MAIKVFDSSELIKKRQLNMLVYGAPGVGKTTFASTSEKPFFIDLENGALSICDKHLTMTIVTNIKEFNEGIDYALKNGFKSICIDSLTRYFDFLMDDVLARERRVKPQIQDYGTIVTEVKRLLWMLQSKSVNTIFICAEKEVEEDGRIKYRPALSSGLITTIPGIMDVVGYMYVTATNERRLSVNASHKFYAKHRAPISNKIKDDIEPNFQILSDKIYSAISVESEARVKEPNIYEGLQPVPPLEPVLPKKEESEEVKAKNESLEAELDALADKGEAFVTKKDPKKCLDCDRVLPPDYVKTLVEQGKEIRCFAHMAIHETKLKKEKANV